MSDENTSIESLFDEEELAIIDKQGIQQIAPVFAMLIRGMNKLLADPKIKESIGSLTDNVAEIAMTATKSFERAGYERDEAVQLTAAMLASSKGSK